MPIETVLGSRRRVKAVNEVGFRVDTERWASTTVMGDVALGTLPARRA